MKILVPKSYSDDVWVALQKYLFNDYDEAGTICSIEESDVIEHGVDAIFQNEFGKSIYDVALEELGDEAFKEEKDLRIYDHVKSASLLDFESPDINYKNQIRGSFDWEYDFLFGRLLRAIGYAMDENGDRIESEPIVNVVFDYEIDQVTSGYVDKRLKTVRYYKKDGSLSWTRKFMKKRYRGFKGPDEAERRRHNIINLLQKEIQDFLIIGGSSEQEATATSQGFIQTIKQEVDDYVVWAFRDILTAIENHPAELMDAPIAPGFTVRDFILSRINYWPYEEVQGGQYRGSDL